MIADVILETTGATADDLSQTELGASWGEEIAKRSLIGLAVFLVLVVLFIWAYFREWKMSVGRDRGARATTCSSRSASTRCRASR